MSQTPAPDTLSHDLQTLLDRAGDSAISVGDILQQTRGRGLHTMAIFLCLPFLSPISIPGMSMPFGLATAICGLRIATRRDPWLPAWVLKKEIPQPAASKILGLGIRMHRIIEKRLHPRMPALADGQTATLIAGLGIMYGAFLMSLPIPPPFPVTNTLPSAGVIILCLGLLERDGLAILVGYILLGITTIYFLLIALLGTAGLAYLWQKITNF